MNIQLNSFTQEAATKTKGLYLKEILEKGLQTAEAITVDFSGITRFASPFFNNSFAALALKYGFTKIEQIRLIHLSDVGKDAYDSSMDNAKMLSSDPEFAAKVNQIIQDPPKKTEV